MYCVLCIHLLQVLCALITCLTAMQNSVSIILVPSSLNTLPAEFSEQYCNEFVQTKCGQKTIFIACIALYCDKVKPITFLSTIEENLNCVL